MRPRPRQLSPPSNEPDNSKKANSSFSTLLGLTQSLFRLPTTGDAAVESEKRKRKENNKVCPTDEFDAPLQEGSTIQGASGVVGGEGSGSPSRYDGGRCHKGAEEREEEGGEVEMEVKVEVGKEEEETESNTTKPDDESSGGEFWVNVDVVDDVTCDEGFELGEVSYTADG